MDKEKEDFESPEDAIKDAIRFAQKEIKIWKRFLADAKRRLRK